MAYRAPRFCHVHAARQRGWVQLSFDGDSVDADFPRYHLVDDRANTRFKFSGAPTDPNIDLDLGATPITGINRLIIPPDHFFETLKIWGDSDSNFGSPDVLHATDTSVTAGQQIDLEFDTAASTERYIRLDITGGPANFYCTQLYYTEIMTLDVGPDLSDSPDGYKANVTRIEQNTGQSPTILHGPQQRVLEYDYPAGLEGTDLTKMEAFIAAVGMDKPFYVDPHSFSDTPATDDPPIKMKFSEMPESRLFVNVASTGVERKTFNLKLIESLD